MSGGGGGGPTSTTVTQSNVPDWLRPQVETLLGSGIKELFNTTRTGTAPQYDEKGNLVEGTGYTYDITGVKPFQPYSTKPEDYVAGFSPLQQQVQSNAANLQVPEQFNYATGLGGQAGLGSIGAGGAYAQQVTSPTDVAAYMSPYQQNVTDQQVAAAQRQADIAAQQRKAAAVRAGAFGGSRQAIENAEANRALQTQIGGIQAQGLQNAYNQAIQNMQYGAGLGLQGYGQAGQIAGQLGQLGTAQLGAQTGILGLQGQIGGEQQAQQQAMINQAIQNYANQQQNAYNTLSQYNALLRGYAVPGQTTSMYQAQPSVLSQVAGLGGVGTGIYGLSQMANKKAGGVVKDGIDELAIRKVMDRRAAA
jgi:hypothetical protein